MVTLPPGPSTFLQEEKTMNKMKIGRISLFLFVMLNFYHVKIQLRS